MTATAANSNTKRVVSPEAILSYPHLAEAQPPQNGQGKAKFSGAFVFLKGSDLTKLKAAAIAAGQEKWGDKFAAMVKQGALKLPFRMDGESKGYPEGSTFINARSEQQPQCVYSWPESGKKTPARIPQERIKEDLYPGAIVRVSLTAFAYDTNGNKGVSFALNNVQKIKDGERLDSRVAAEDEFDADLSQAPADLDSLVGEDDVDSIL